jgi:Flp pilus assembly protein TadG
MLVMGKSAHVAQELRRPDRERRRTRHRGQSLVEFTVVLPVLLAIVGIVIDASRVYQAWTNLESATRDAAQYLARSSVDPLSPDYTYEGLDSDTKAIYLLDTATGASFSRSDEQGELGDCDQPQLTTTYSTNTSLAAGGSTAYPLGTAKVMTCLPFHTLFSYPFLGTDGVWILRSEREMTMIVGR